MVPVKRCFYFWIGGLGLLGCLQPNTRTDPPDDLDRVAMFYAQSIRDTDIRYHISALAHDSMAGRETGHIGQKKAAKYIASAFERLGLRPIVPTESGEFSYYQPFPVDRTAWSHNYMRSDRQQYDHLKDMIYLSDRRVPEEKNLEMVFVSSDTEAPSAAKEWTGKLLAFDLNSFHDWRSKISLLRAQQAAGAVFFVDEQQEDFTRHIHQHQRYLNARYTFPQQVTRDTQPLLFALPSAVFSDFFGVPYANRLQIKGQKTQLALKTTEQIQSMQTENVLGYLEGTDKKEEVLILTAHYDHLGQRGESIYNGADDNASGTSAILELAEAFTYAAKQGHRPRRSILFMAVSGEEKGLLGSYYYTLHPVLPLAQTIANLNIDMIGRIDEFHEGDPNYVYLIGSDKLSQELHDISEEANTRYTQLALDYRYNADDDPNRFYYRSDHYNFARQNIPIIFYFNGTHVDYHEPTDTIDKIVFSKVTHITQLIFHTAWALAQRDTRPALKEGAHAQEPQPE